MSDDDMEGVLDPFLGGPMPGKDAALGEIRLTLSGKFGPILDLPLMAATALAEAYNGVLFSFEYHRPCPHDEDEPCTCSPDTHMAVLRLQVLDPPPQEAKPPADTIRLHINAGGAIRLNELQIGALPAECRPARSVIVPVSLHDLWKAIGPEIAAYITGRSTEQESPRSGYCTDERCGRTGLHPEHS